MVVAGSWRRRVGVGAVMSAIAFAGGSSAFASPSAPDESDASLSGPIASVSKEEVEPGGRVVVTIDGFDSLYVTLSICGNEARRGSADCNMAASEGVEVGQIGTALAIEMPVAAPPTDCPCVIRIVGQDTSELAVVPIVITDHPVGPVVDPPSLSNLLVVSIEARSVPRGVLDALRADLGGRTEFEVAVKVKNVSTTPLRQVRLSGSAGRNTADDSLVSLELDDPGLIGVGQTWQQTLNVVVPAPSLGTVEWQVAVSGAGPTIIATHTTKHRPWLLIVMMVILVASVTTLLIRWRVRRRAEREAALEAAGGADGAEDVAAGADGADAGGGIVDPITPTSVPASDQLRDVLSSRR
jgi:hypothetical protein